MGAVGSYGVRGVFCRCSGLGWCFMSDQTYISEAAALRILMQQGDYSENQARIILMHSLKQSFSGANYYPMKYIYKRAQGRG